MMKLSWKHLACVSVRHSGQSQPCCLSSSFLKDCSWSHQGWAVDTLFPSSPRSFSAVNHCLVFNGLLFSLLAILFAVFVLNLMACPLLAINETVCKFWGWQFSELLLRKAVSRSAVAQWLLLPPHSKGRGSTIFLHHSKKVVGWIPGPGGGVHSCWATQQEDVELFLQLASLFSEMLIPSAVGSLPWKFNSPNCGTSRTGISHLLDKLLLNERPGR